MNIILTNDEFCLNSIGNFNTIKGNVSFGKNVTIGNCCTIEATEEHDQIHIGDDVKIGNNVVIKGNVKIGKESQIFDGCNIGHSPHYKGAWSKKGKSVIVGEKNVIREFCIINSPFYEITKIGNENFIMSNVTIGHDSQIENETVISAGSCIAGHCHLKNGCNVGMNSEIHQFVKIGDYSMVGMGTSIKKDVLPFHMIHKDRISLNINGMSRNKVLERYGFSSEELCNYLIDESNKESSKVRDFFEKFVKESSRGYYNLKR